MESLDETTLNSLGLAFVLSMSILLLLLPRKYAAAPIIITVCYMTLGQYVFIGGMHFNIVRILVIAGVMRIIARERSFRIEFNSIDKGIIIYLGVSLFMYAILYRAWSPLVTKLGYTYSDLGVYIIFRYLIREHDDIVRVFKQMAIIAVPLAILMLVENNSGRNMFSYFGGVREYSEFRDGRLRCQGPFRHPILAGTFGATIFPFFVALIVRGSKLEVIIALLGIISATIITITSASSGPLLSYGFVVVGLMAWKIRDSMRTVRWTIVLAIIALHIIMKEPVWFIYARISGKMGGTGWHRSELIDQALRHLNEWWLIGTTYTAHWMLLQLPIDPNMVDITNQYLLVGVNGGLISMALFIVIIVRSFSTIGTIVGSNITETIRDKFFVWAIGCALFGHVATFMSVAYFDQMSVSWYLLLSMIAVLHKYAIRSES